MVDHRARKKERETWYVVTGHAESESALPGGSGGKREAAGVDPSFDEREKKTAVFRREKKPAQFVLSGREGGEERDLDHPKAPKKVWPSV